MKSGQYARHDVPLTEFAFIPEFVELYEQPDPPYYTCHTSFFPLIIIRAGKSINLVLNIHGRGDVNEIFNGKPITFN